MNTLLEKAIAWINVLYHVHICWELAECFVKIVHLGQNADAGDDHEHIGRGVGKLIVAGKGQLEGNAECFDGHDRNRSHEGADAEVDEWVLLSIDGRYLVDHEH